MAGLSAAATVYHCGADRKAVQDTPCAVINAPIQPPPRPPCDLDPERLRLALRQEEQFLTRFPDEATHRAAQRADLQPIVVLIGKGQERLNELVEQRKPIDKELAFYVNKPIPPWLKAQVEESDARFNGLAQTLREHEQSIAVVQARYRCERATYGKRWTGAAPGASACDRSACAPP